MAPHGEAIAYTRSNTSLSKKPPKLSNDNLHRTRSDISFELSKQEIESLTLPTISEVVDAKCECCGMSEECTPEYIDRVRSKFRGKWICGLCAEAVKEEIERNGSGGGGQKGDLEEALSAHMSACSRFNKFGRAYPVLFQAEAMREILKKSTRRAKSFPRDHKEGQNNSKGGLARSSSCIPAITREINDLTITN